MTHRVCFSRLTKECSMQLRLSLQCLLDVQCSVTVQLKLWFLESENPLHLLIDRYHILGGASHSALLLK